MGDRGRARSPQAFGATCEEFRFSSEFQVAFSHSLGRWWQSLSSLISKTVNAHLYDVRHSSCARALEDVVVFATKGFHKGDLWYKADIQHMALSCSALNSCVCDKRQKLLPKYGHGDVLQKYIPPLLELKLSL